MNRRLIYSLIFFTLAVSCLPVSAADNGDAASLASIINQKFCDWDLDRDGVLTKDELDRAMQNPRIRGDEAAALAAIKVYSRSVWDKDTTNQSFSIGTLCQSDSSGSGGTSGTGNKLAKLFLSFKKKIGNSSPRLFANGVPHIDDIKQGKSGDCYFLSTVGGMAYHTPQRVINMITPYNDGSYGVTFPRHDTITVAAPTDAEIACYSDAGEDGMWLHVLEKAYAIYKNQKGRKGAVEPLDLVIHGGSGARMLMFMTGNSCTRYPTSSTSIYDLRRYLSEALSAHRIVNTGTKGHCLTVLSYDPSSDIVTIWNPWGTSGVYGTVHQKMDHGVFSMPLTDLQKYFVSILPEEPRPWTSADFQKFR